MENLTTIKRPNIGVLKEKLEHAKDKQFYVTKDNNYQIDLIIGDTLYCKEVFKRRCDEPIVEGTTFGWVIHGSDYPVNKCLFTTEVSDYERLYSLDIRRQQKFYILPERYKQIRRFEQRSFVGTNSRRRAFARNVESVYIA